ncbi:orphan G-protein coupled receptor 45 [Plakobranchus ocellatus]|uniref:Orphan G-protein coupled receptor 45 n=1 Tax=Plakobranchus ocellatus TaxID=259542 RepID=A0AAV4DFL8_9GAST|nr:orphan G-protein coupled receptor 45 [Plakobranchus ocellatus]
MGDELKNLNMSSDSWGGEEEVSTSELISVLYSGASGNSTATEEGYIRPSFPRPRRSDLAPVLSGLTQFAMPFILSVGIVGSMALVVVFMCTPLRRSALANYLTAGGVTNTIYLLCSTVHWFTAQGFQVLNVTGVCQMTMFALHLSKFLAIWYLILAHLERLVVQFSSSGPMTSTARHCHTGRMRTWSGADAQEGAMLEPSVKKWCGRFRAKCIIIVVFVFSMVGFLHYSWTYMVIGNMCMIMPESYKHIIVLHKIEIFASPFLAGLIILIIDISILTSKLVRLGTRLLSRASTPSRSPTSQKSGTFVPKDVEWRGEYTLASTGHNGVRVGSVVPTSGRSTPNSSGSRSPTSCRSKDKKLTSPSMDLTREQGRATAVVIIEGILFMAIVMPSSVLQLKVLYGKATWLYADMLTLMEEMVKLNAATKFFLYLMLLPSFRQGLLHLICSCCRKRKLEQCQSLQETSV